MANHDIYHAGQIQDQFVLSQRDAVESFWIMPRRPLRFQKTNKLKRHLNSAVTGVGDRRAIVIFSFGTEQMRALGMRKATPS